jgi:hypothetical protein
MGTVFARLKVPDSKGGVVDHGVHAFIVPLRDESGRTLPGVEIQDCGYKVGRGAAGGCAGGGVVVGWGWLGAAGCARWEEAASCSGEKPPR